MVDTNQHFLRPNRKSAANSVPADAYDWCAYLHSGELTPEEYDAYLTWSDNNPEGKAMVEELGAMWTKIGEVDIDNQVLKNHFRNRNSRFATAIQKFNTHWITGAGMIAATCLVLLAFTVTLHYAAPQGNLYETQRAERRVINLIDGTVVYLSAMTRIRTVYSPLDRQLFLEQGEAFFDVAHDISRPFRVKVDNGEIRALGTQFNVKWNSDEGAIVTLLTGKIRVNALEDKKELEVEILDTPGERAILTLPEINATDSDQANSNNKKTILLASVDTSNIASWRDGKLIYKGTQLADALKEISQHANHEIILDDPIVGQMPLFGVFNTGDWRGVLSALVKSYPVYAERVSEYETHLKPTTP